MHGISTITPFPSDKPWAHCGFYHQVRAQKYRTQSQQPQSPSQIISHQPRQFNDGRCLNCHVGKSCYPRRKGPVQLAVSIGLLGSRFPEDLASLLLLIMLPLALARCSTCSTRWAGARRFVDPRPAPSKLGLFYKCCMQNFFIIYFLSLAPKALCQVLGRKW